MATAVRRIKKITPEKRIKLAIFAASAIAIALSALIGAGDKSILLGFEIPGEIAPV